MYRLLHSHAKKHHTIKKTDVCKNEVVKNEEREMHFKKKRKEYFFEKIFFNVYEYC